MCMEATVDATNFILFDSSPYHERVLSEVSVYLFDSRDGSLLLFFTVFIFPLNGLENIPSF